MLTGNSKFYVKTPSFTLEEGDSQFISQENPHKREISNKNRQNLKEISEENSRKMKENTSIRGKNCDESEKKFKENATPENNLKKTEENEKKIKENFMIASNSDENAKKIKEKALAENLLQRTFEENVKKIKENAIFENLLRKNSEENPKNLKENENIHEKALPTQENSKKIKGIKVQINSSDLKRLLKKGSIPQEEEQKLMKKISIPQEIEPKLAIPQEIEPKLMKNISILQEEELNYKEKEEFLNRILVLEKTIQRKNEIIEKNLRQINEAHKNEENLKLQFYKQSKENSNKMKSVLAEFEQYKEKRLQFEENSLEIQRKLQISQEKLLYQENIINNLNQELSEKNEENKRLFQMNNEFLSENHDFEASKRNFFQDFQGFNEKIKALNEENQGLKEKFTAKEIEIQTIMAQKDFILNLYEKNKDELENHEKKNRESQELMIFYANNNKKNEENLLELKKEIKQTAFEREEALSKQTSLIIELQNLKIKFLRKNPEKTVLEERIPEEKPWEDMAYLRKENQLLQKKLELLMASVSEEKEENSDVMKSTALEIEKLKKENTFTEKRRMELEAELIQMSRSSRTFLISEEFEGLKRNFDAKLRFYQENAEKNEEKMRGFYEENERLRTELVEKSFEIKKMQIQKDDIYNNSDKKPKENSFDNEILKEKDGIILNCHEKIEELYNEIMVLKEKIDEIRISKEGENEMEIARVSVENEKIIKKLKENEHKNEVIHKEKDKIEREFKNSEEKSKFCEKELVECKERISFLLMKAVEIGGHELVDKLTGLW